ncbi:hypothetical protein TWF696_004419 [Orbilia brochopaga]|uniref:Uncharacterized protein n=1 Tax=Orbilia brochopaga TaxID=3140254 RepID=A0AAV9V7A1_9PEZI
MHHRLSSTLARRCGQFARPPLPSSPFAAPPSYIIHRRQLSLQSFVPRVFSPSWWSQQLPKDLFKPRPTSASAARPWNPAWGFIILALFVGSQSLNIIALRQDAAVFVRRADARIRTLQEIVRKIQDGEWEANGEEVQKALRLGKVARDDREWEEVMREIENEDAKWQAEVQRQRELLEQQEAERAKFAALESPTAWSRDGQKKGKKVTADDYLV